MGHFKFTVIIMFLTYFSDIFATVIHRIDDIEKPLTDRRSYRGLVLSNGLKVLLISDSSAKKAAASMTVGVGALEDTVDVPGLAKLMACMLMRGGSKSVSSEVNFQVFLRRRAGKIYWPLVACRQQNFLIDVKPSCLAETLDRFARTFISPMLSDPLVLRQCVEAIGKEYEDHSKIDIERISEIEKSLSKKMFAYKHFYFGSQTVFQRMVRESPRSLIEKVEAFYSMWYSANIMSLVVLGTENLDDLQRIVVPPFASIKNKDARPIFYEFKHHPWSPEQLGHKVYIKPQNDDTKNMTFLHIIFPVPDDCSSSTYIAYFLSRGEEHGLVSSLQDRDLCAKLIIELTVAGGISFFSVQCNLNTDSTEEDIDIILHSLFQYLRLLNPDDLPKWISDENYKMLKLAHMHSKPNYEEYLPFIRELSHNLQAQSDLYPDKSLPEIVYKEAETSYQTYVEASCVEIILMIQLHLCLQTYPMEKILMRTYLDGEWNPSLIREFLEHLRPEKMNAIIVGKQFDKVPANRLEIHYGTSYAVEKLSAELIQSYNTKELISGLKFPQPNEFLPENFLIYPSSKLKRKYPYKFYESSKCEMWFKQDDECRTPTVQMEFQIFCSPAQLGPFESALWGVLQDLLHKTIRRHFGYHAEKAVAKWEFNWTNFGIHIKLYGYNDKLSVLLEKILDLMVNFRDHGEDFNANRFELSRNEFTETLKNSMARNPAFQTRAYTEHLLEHFGWVADTIVHIGSLLQFDDMVKFLTKAFRRIFIRGFAYGNYTEQDAMGVVEILEKSFRSSFGLLLQEIMLSQRFVEIAPGSHSLLQVWNKSEKYGCSSYFHLHNQPSTVEKVTVFLMSEIISNYYPSTRTQGENEDENETLICFLVEKPEILGLMVNLLSADNPRKMSKKLDTFLNDIYETLVSLTTSRLKWFKSKVQMNKYAELPIRDRILVANLYWEEIQSRRYQFDRFEMEMKQLSSLTKHDLIHYFQEMLGATSRRRCQLVTQVFPITDLAKRGTAFMNQFIDSGATRIEDFTVFKNNSTLLSSNYYANL